MFQKIVLILIFFTYVEKSYSQNETQPFSKSLYLTNGERFSIDEKDHLKVEVGFGMDRGSRHGQLSIIFFQDVNSKRPSEKFAKSIKILKNGQDVTHFYEDYKEVHAFLDIDLWRFSTQQNSAEEKSATYEIRFLDQTLSKFDVNFESEQIKTQVRSRLSQFDVRSAYNETLESKDIYLVSSEKKYNKVKVDLHNHYAGAINAEDIWSVAVQKGALYPVEYLKEMFPKANLANWLGSDFIKHHGKEYFKMKEAFLFEKAFKDAISIQPGETVDFDRLEQIYKWRSPLTKNIELAPDFLTKIAKSYSEQGIKYVELSLSDIVESNWLEMAKLHVPKIAKEYGVEIRFMAAIWRSGDHKYMNSVVDKISNVIHEPLIAGCDFMGEEVNATSDFKAELLRLSNLKKVRPGFQVRVHAGENPKFPNNVKEAIEFGATRIGHGIYGVDDSTLQLAREKNVIIELNLNSNIALKNVYGRTELPIKKYLDSGVRLTLGSDGQGVYVTTNLSEESVFRSLGASDEDMKRLLNSDQKYIIEQAENAKLLTSNVVQSNIKILSHEKSMVKNDKPQSRGVRSNKCVSLFTN